MRRKDREMDRKFGIEVIDRARYGVLSMVTDGNEPYGVPISIVRDGNSLYFHSAKDGKKVKVLTNNPNVSIVFVGEVKVPENYTEEQLTKIAKDESKAALLISKVFTTEYESAIVKGRVNPVEDIEEKSKAMRLICEKYTPTKRDYFDMAIRAGLKRTNVYKVEIKEIKAKRKKYDTYGEEIKQDG
ncbi:MAG: pyridoxamine 5'-phosphate oxidase family protein [Natronincolaceae bacterium]|jgi:nitroimidazol reductase NimA-like FMN-containing flavoprotein (pyridoxamine 5'-phosphate oxidase superfamily)|nr:pyridoxamine 5'-phosphate oxidase family protein [Bacillota bacterium]